MDSEIKILLAETCVIACLLPGILLFYFLGVHSTSFSDPIFVLMFVMNSDSEFDVRLNLSLWKRQSDIVEEFVTEFYVNAIFVGHG